MPTNRAATAGRGTNRSNSLIAYAKFNSIVVPPKGHIGGLNARFSSFANTIQTRLNSSTGTTGGLGGTLQAQVNSAISQVLRQPGNGTTTAVATYPAATSIATMVGGAGGVQPSMPPAQAALLREARIIQADFLSLLDSMQPLSPYTDPGDAACLQALVRAEVNGLLEEFAYTRLQPRQQRARVFLGSLLGYDFDAYGVSSPIGQNGAGQNPPTGDIQALVNLFNLGGPVIPTISVEDQLASQQALATDGALFDTQWNNFWSLVLQNSPTSPTSTLLGAGSQVPWPLWEWPVGSPLATVLTPLETFVRGGLGRLLPQSGAFPLIPFGPGGPQLPNQASLQIGVIQKPSGPNVSQSYAEKIIQADLLMPVIADDASRAEADLTAIGFTAGEQETTFAWFWSAVDADLLDGGRVPVVPPVPSPPSWQVLSAPTYMPAPGLQTPIPVWMTVADILDWAQNLAGPTSADYLRQAGALGLNLICDQADELFWLVLAMLDPTATAQIPALGDTEVQLELFSLATDLNTLANLAY